MSDGIFRIEPIEKLSSLYTLGPLGGDIDPITGLSPGDETADNEFIEIVGGRGGGKSEGVAQVFTLISRLESTRILCTREIQKSMKDSVYKMIEDWIDAMGIRYEFDITRDSIVNNFTGTDFIFMGMEAAVRTDSLKSLKGVKYVWYEEAQTATRKSIKKLTPTIRVNGRKIIFTMNRDTVKDTVIEHFKDRKKVFRISVNYVDNQYCPQSLIDEAEEDKLLSIDDWKHVWMGEPRAEDAQRVLLPLSWLSQCVDLHKKLGYEVTGKTMGGFDVAEGTTTRHDKNSLITRTGPLVKTAEEWQAEELYISANHIDARYRELGFSKLYFDANSLGAGIKSDFARMNEEKKLPYYVIPFKGGMKVLGPDKVYIQHEKNKILNRDQFANQKSQGWWNLRLRLENSIKLIKGLKIDRPDYFLSFDSSIPDLDGFFMELSQVIFDEDRAGKLIIIKTPGEKESEIEGKKIKVRSPNRGDGLKYAYLDDIKNGLRAHRPSVSKGAVII